MENSDDNSEPDLGSQSPYEPVASNLGSVYPEAEEVVEATLVPAIPPPTPRPLSTSGYISWLFVLALTIGITTIVATVQFMGEEEIGGDAGPIDLMQVQLQGKFIVGHQELSKFAPGAPASPLPAELDTGCYEQRICYSILLGEINSPTESLEYLEDLDAKAEEHGLELTEDQTRMRKLVYELMGNYESENPDSNAIPESDRQFLEDKLGWTGKLALYPSDSPHQSERSSVVSRAFGLTISGLVAMMIGFLAGLAGFITAIVFSGLLLSGKLKARFANHPTDHNIYIETFAIWILFFFGASILSQYSDIEDPAIKMMIHPIIFFGSLISLLWPVFRGVSFAQVRQDIGWRFENPFKEILSAMGAYLALLPFMLPGLGLVVLLMNIIGLMGPEPHEFARQSGPGHPIQEDIMSGNFVTIFFVFIATCVAAPVVEETMFRGVLYRHLRDLTCSWSHVISVIFSAIANGLIFAAIHPQGIVAIPVLTTLAIGFTMARQWRDSLLAPMTMHAIHNFLITCVSLLIL